MSSYNLKGKKLLNLNKEPIFFISKTKNLLGDFGFSISNGGEEIKLFNNLNQLVDSVLYDDAFPWPTEPDGTGSTLSLKNPEVNNAKYQSWAASGGYGTPGLINDVYTTSVDEENTPTNFRLFQNYPNPFNPITTIKFNWPVRENVKIEIFNLLGQKVMTLVDKNYQAGQHKIEFNGEHIASGVYFYKITAGEFIETKKMILLN